MTGPILAVLLVLLLGFPLAFAWCRDAATAVVIAPLVTATLATAAVLLMVLVGGPLLPWLVAAVVASLIAVPFVRRRSVRLPLYNWREWAWLAAPLSPPLLLVFAAPKAWDAKSIWWLHAAYFAHGGAAARAAIGSPVYNSFSHTDYPPLPSASVAAAWSVLPGYDYYVAQMVSTLVTFSAIVLLAFAVRTAIAAAGPVIARLAGIFVGLACWSAGSDLVASGYSDVLWAAAFVAAVVLLFLAQPEQRQPPLVALLLIVAGMAKNEGTIMVLALTVVVALKERRNLRAVWWLALPFATSLVWLVTSRIFGAVSDLASSPYLRPSTDVLALYADRFPTIVRTLGKLSAPSLVPAILVATIGWILFRKDRSLLRIGSDVWLAVVGVLYAGALLVVYLTTPNDLAWHLLTSAERVTLPITLLACVCAAAWAATALVRLGQPMRSLLSRVRPAGPSRPADSETVA